MDSEPAAPHQLAATAPAVLLVDQDFLARWKAADYLRERGYNIIEATGAADAMAVLASGTRVDVVLLDLHSRDASDNQLLAEWLEQHHPGLPLLMTSKTAVGAALLAPSRRHLVIVEPYELAQLAAHLESILKRVS
jgi:two-component system, response regulator PdtaR